MEFLKEVTSRNERAKTLIEKNVLRIVYVKRYEKIKKAIDVLTNVIFRRVVPYLELEYSEDGSLISKKSKVGAENSKISEAEGDQQSQSVSVSQSQKQTNDFESNASLSDQESLGSSTVLKEDE